MHRGLTAAARAAAVCLAAFGCAPVRPPVLLITVEGLPPGILASPDSPVPGLRRLVKRSRVFTRAYAAAQDETAGFGCLATGRHAADHGVRGPDDFVDVGVPTLGELLVREGYVVAASLPPAAAGSVRGFRPLPGNSPPDAIRALASSSTQPWAAWVHLAPPAGLDEFHRVQWIDVEVGAVIHTLDLLGLLDRSVVLLAGAGDAVSLSDRDMAIPLCIRLPGGVWGDGPLDRLVSTVDVLPTVLAAVGAQRPGGLPGVDLTSSVDRRPVDGIAADGLDGAVAVWLDSAQLLHDPQSGVWRLTDRGAEGRMRREVPERDARAPVDLWQFLEDFESGGAHSLPGGRAEGL